MNWVFCFTFKWYDINNCVFFITGLKYITVKQTFTTWSCSTEFFGGDPGFQNIFFCYHHCWREFRWHWKSLRNKALAFPRDKFKIAVWVSSEVFRVTRHWNWHWGSFQCKKEQDKHGQKQYSGTFTTIKTVLRVLVERTLKACFHL